MKGRQAICGPKKNGGKAGTRVVSLRRLKTQAGETVTQTSGIGVKSLGKMKTQLVYTIRGGGAMKKIIQSVRELSGMGNFGSLR